MRTKRKKDETEHDQTARYINRTESNGLVNKLRLYILLQGFRITCLFTGQYNTKVYDTITDVM